MGTAIPAATDVLIAIAKTSTSSYKFNNQPVRVEDGPIESQHGITLCIGLTTPPDMVEGPCTGSQTVREWYGMAAAETIEDFTVPCYIDVIAPGTTEAMVQVRQAAADILDLFWAAIRANPSLKPAADEDGLVSGLARIPNADFLPSGVTRGAQQGRRMTVQFGVRCINEYVT
jgi:hypothetical protein